MPVKTEEGEVSFGPTELGIEFRGLLSGSDLPGGPMAVAGL